MSFTVFAQSTTAYANEVIENFYHIFKGDRNPLGGVNMELTTSIYDIGSSTYRWRDLFCNSLQINDNVVNGKNWILNTTVNITTTSSSITISGLNGDSDVEYIIDLIYKDINTQSALYLYLNGVSTASYGYLKLYLTGSTKTCTRDVTENQIVACNNTRLDTTTAVYCFSRIIIYAKTGSEKNVQIQEANSFNLVDSATPYIGGYYYTNYVYTSTTLTITSLIFQSSVANQIASGTKILLYSRSV